MPDTCRICGLTPDGRLVPRLTRSEPCEWVDDDLCSACACVFCEAETAVYDDGTRAITCKTCIEDIATQYEDLIAKHYCAECRTLGEQTPDNCRECQASKFCDNE